MASLCHPWFTTTNLSYRFPLFETSATALCGTTGMNDYYMVNDWWLTYPSEKLWSESQLGWWTSQNNPNVPNHQPASNLRVGKWEMIWGEILGLVAASSISCDETRTASLTITCLCVLHWPPNLGHVGPNWLVYNGKSYQNGWFRFTPISGNPHVPIVPSHINQINHQIMLCWLPELK